MERKRMVIDREILKAFALDVMAAAAGAVIIAAPMLFVHGLIV